MARGFGDEETERSEDPGAVQVVRHHPQLVWRDAAGEHGVVVDRTMEIGSASGVAIVIEDRTVSRLHAEVEPRPDGLWIRDLGSRNGTFVEGILVGSACVPEGGTMRVGQTTIARRAAVTANVDLWPHPSFGPLVGSSVPMRELYARMAKVAASDATVLVTGERDGE